MSELIRMVKGDEEHLVQPSNVRAHQRQGWEIVQPAPPAPVIPESKPAAVVSEEAPEAIEIVTEVEPPLVVKPSKPKKSRKK